MLKDTNMWRNYCRIVKKMTRRQKIYARIAIEILWILVFGGIVSVLWLFTIEFWFSGTFWAGKRMLRLLGYGALFFAIVSASVLIAEAVEGIERDIKRLSPKKRKKR